MAIGSTIALAKRKKKEDKPIQQDFLEKQGLVSQNPPGFLESLQSKSQEQTPKIEDTGFVVHKDQSGEIVGFDRNGKTYYRPKGLSDEEWFGNIEALSSQEARKTNVPQGATIAGTAQKQYELQQQIGQIGQIGALTDATEAPIDWGQALTAGGAKILPSMLGGAGIGAAAGLMGSAGALSIPGAIVGGVTGSISGFVGGVMTNIKAQQKGELQAADIELTNARTNMRQLAMLASQDPANADIYIAQYNAQLTRVYQARRQTAAEVAGNLNKFMEDGREQLADFDAFIQPGGIADIYGQKLQTSLQSGVPLSVYGDQLI